MHNLRTIMWILSLTTIFSLTACATNQEQTNYSKGGTYQLSNQDIEAFLEFAFDENPQLVRWENDVTYEIVGEYLHLFRPDFLSVLRNVAELTGTRFSPAPFGERADYTIYFGRRTFETHTLNEITPTFASHSDQCRMSMYADESGRILRTRISFRGNFFRDGSMNLGPHRASLENRIDFLNCLEYPFLNAFGALGASPSSIATLNGRELEMNGDLRSFVLLKALYSSSLEIGMGPNEARAALMENRSIQLPDMPKFEKAFLKIWPHVPL